MAELGFGLYFLILFLMYLALPQRWVRMKNLRITQKKMVDDVLLWCHQNYFPTPKNHKLQYKIHYYQHKKFDGLYCGISKTITLYITPEKRVIDVIDTILHEYQHYMDIQNIKQVNHYSELLNQVGYIDHPMEISARKFAKKHRVKCFENFQRKWF